jgi:hypothetical protein
MGERDIHARRAAMYGAINRGIGARVETRQMETRPGYVNEETESWCVRAVGCTAGGLDDAVGLRLTRSSRGIDLRSEPYVRDIKGCLDSFSRGPPASFSSVPPKAIRYRLRSVSAKCVVT